jgi:hypothetical protein
MEIIDFTSLREVDAFIAEKYFRWIREEKLGQEHLVPYSSCSLGYSASWEPVNAKSKLLIVPDGLPRYTRNLDDAGILLSELAGEDIRWSIVNAPSDDPWKYQNPKEYSSWFEVGDRQFRFDATGNMNSIYLSIVTGFLFVKGVEAAFNGKPMCQHRNVLKDE